MELTTGGVFYLWLVPFGQGGYSYDFGTYAYDFSKNEIFGISCAIVDAKFRSPTEQRIHHATRGDAP